MDDDADDLVLQLCTRAGMLMEDASAIALTIRTVDPHDRMVVLTELRQAIERMARLVDGALAMSS